MEIYLQLFLYHLHSLNLFRIVTYHNIFEATKFLNCFLIDPRIIGRGAKYNKLNKHGVWAFSAIAVVIEVINMIANETFNFVILFKYGTFLRPLSSIFVAVY